MRFRQLLFMLLAASTLLGVGCGRVSMIRYVRGVEFDPNAAAGLPVDQAYVDDAVMKLRGGKILVQFEDPAKTIDRSVSKVARRLDEGDSWSKVRGFFEMDFSIALKDQRLSDGRPLFSDVQRATTALSTFQPDAVLKLAITEWHEGNKFWRALLGVGFGHTRMQYEGVLTDARTGQILFAFADARIHPGGPSAFGFPLKVWRGDDLIAEDLTWAAKDLAKTLRIVIETEPDTY